MEGFLGQKSAKDPSDPLVPAPWLQFLDHGRPFEQQEMSTSEAMVKGAHWGMETVCRGEAEPPFPSGGSRMPRLPEHSRPYSGSEGSVYVNEGPVAKHKCHFFFFFFRNL